MTYLELRDTLNNLPDETLDGNASGFLTIKDKDGNNIGLEILLKNIGIVGLYRKTIYMEYPYLELETRRIFYEEPEENESKINE